MGIRRRAFGRAGLAVIGAATVLASAGSANAFAPLPPGGQVNDDLAAGIDRTLGVSGEDPANADVVGGALTAGKVAVPWAIFRQQRRRREGPGVLTLLRAAAPGRHEAGTVGGRSSAAPMFPGSLNFDQTQDGEAPAIDFAGAGRTVPWATWYESTTGAGFANNNVFASRFDNTGDANQGKWVFAGQSRGLGGGTVPVPSLNIHTDQDAENPSVAGGSTADPAKPGPWVSWQETGGNAPHRQPDLRRKAARARVSQLRRRQARRVLIGGGSRVGGFCWQQVGSGACRHCRRGPQPQRRPDPQRDRARHRVHRRLGRGALGRLVRDRHRRRFRPPQQRDGLRGQGRRRRGAADGGFHWVAVGSAAPVRRSTRAAPTCSARARRRHRGPVLAQPRPAADAEDPRVAAGTMNPANPTVPWVAWDETVAGVKQVFVSRLVGTARPRSSRSSTAVRRSRSAPATRPAPTSRSRATRRTCTWREDVGGGVEQAFVGHFINAAARRSCLTRPTWR